MKAPEGWPIEAKENNMWEVSSSGDPRALAIVDGTGKFLEHGPHYSRRTPGSNTFTGVGREVVLVSKDGSAVWAAVLHKTPAKRGTGASRGRSGTEDPNVRWVWRNMVFRNLGPAVTSRLIRDAVSETYRIWQEKYGSLPEGVTLRTEIDPKRVKSANPGYAYKLAGFHNHRVVRGKVYLDAPGPGEFVCECETTRRKLYSVEAYDGTTELCWYCKDCARLAGDTKSITEVSR